MPSVSRAHGITSSNDLRSLLLLPLSLIQLGIQLKMLPMQTITERASSNTLQACIANDRKVPLNLHSFLFTDS
jgi:hypothetical protein